MEPPGNPGRFTFGAPPELNHNIVEIDDANGNVILKNTYGTNPGDVSFDRVIDQQLGDTAHATFQYHDLNLETQYTSAPLPSTPDSAHVQSMTQFKSINVCPSLSCTSSGCASATDDSNAESPRQRPAFATVFTDIHGVVMTDYYGADWDLLREVNWGDATTGAQTSNYNYGFSGQLASDGQVAAVQGPAGNRLCYARNDSGAPTTILHIPSPTYGNADWRAEALTYVDPLNASSVHKYTPDTKSTALTTYAGAIGALRPDSITVQVDATTADVTTLSYAGDFLPHTKTDPSGAVTQYDSFDPLAAQPTTITVDAAGASPLQTYQTFDPAFQVVNESGLKGGAAVRYTYDWAARPTTIQRRNSPSDTWFVQTLSYSNTPYPTAITDSNMTQSLVHDAFGDLSSVTKFPADSDDGPSQRTCNNYTADGRLLSTIRPEGDSTIYQYDAAGRLTTTVRGNDTVAQRGCAAPHPAAGDPGLQTVSSSTYGADGYLKSFTKDGMSYSVSVDGFGRVIETVNGVGVRARTGYDRLDRPVWTAVYQGSNVPAYRAPAFGDAGLVAATETAYDNLGRVTWKARWHLEDKTKRITTVVYNDVARTSTTTENDRTWIVAFDGAGRPVSRVEPDGSTEKTTYSSNGLVAVSTRQTNAGQVITERDYDGLQTLTSVVVNGQQVFSETHDYDGKPTAQSKEGQGTRSFVYDSFRRPKYVFPKAPPGAMPFAMQSLSWDGDDRMVATTAFPGSQTSTFVFDGLDRIIQQSDPLGRTSTFTHVPGANLVATTTLPSGQVRTNTFDGAGELKRAVAHAPSEPNDEVKTFTYSPLGMVATAAISGAPFGTANTVTRSYDSLGRMVSEYNSYVAAGVMHNYDLYDQWKSSWIGAPQSGTPQTNHVYDKLRRLTSIDVRGRRLVDYGYGAIGSGGPLTATYPLIHEKEALSYDGRDRMTGVDVLSTTTNQLRASRHTVYGTDGIVRERQTNATVLSQPLTDLFQVDLMGAVVAENYDVASVPLLTGNVDNTTVAPYMKSGRNWRSYLTDRLANINGTTTPNGIRNRTYNGENQLLTDDAATTIRYDAEDNLKQYGTATAPTTTYDLEHHPVSIDGTSGNLVTAVYDALGRRIGENAGTLRTAYVWDDAQIVGHAVPGSAIELDVPGAGGIDDHVAYEVPVSASPLGGGMVYLHGDADGTVFAASDATGILASYTYSAFGETHKYTRAGSSVTNRYLFQGQLLDSWTSTYSMRSREYIPALARFASTDPLGFAGGMANLYGFGFGNPLSFRDPFGLRPDLRKSKSVQFMLGLVLGYFQGAIPGAFLLPQPPISKSFNRGAAVGLALAGAVDAGEAVLMGGGGAGLCDTGVGCLAGAPAMAGALVLGINAVGDGFRSVVTWEDSSNLMSGDESGGGNQSPSESPGSSSSNPSPADSGSSVPNKATNTLNTIDSTNQAPNGYRGGGTFQNDGRAVARFFPKRTAKEPPSPTRSGT